jgi:hypothetical protein
MAGATDTGENAFLNSVLRGLTTGTPLANAGTCFISLHDTAEPGEGSTYTNLCGGTDYANMAATFGASGDTLATASTLQNTAVITFSSSANVDWGTIVGYGIHLSDTAGNCSAANMVISGVWDSSAVVGTGDTVQIAAGDLVITCG